MHRLGGRLEIVGRALDTEPSQSVVSGRFDRGKSSQASQ